jgi:hypothetical protein
VQVAARGCRGRQPSAAHGYYFTPLRMSHDPGPGHTRFASRSIQVYILLFPFLVLCLITWPLCHDVSGRPLGSSLSGPRRLPCQWRAVSDFGLQISQLQISVLPLWSLQTIQIVCSDRFCRSLFQVFEACKFNQSIFSPSHPLRKIRASAHKIPVSPLKLPRKYSG